MLYDYFLNCFLVFSFFLKRIEVETGIPKHCLRAVEIINYKDVGQYLDLWQDSDDSIHSAVENGENTIKY